MSALIGVFCPDCGRREVSVHEVAVIVYWDGTAEYSFECPACQRFRTLPVGQAKTLELVHATVEVVVEPLDDTSFELAVVQWWGEQR